VRRGAGAAAEGIVTPEAVLLEFAVAGLGSRSLAFLIDLGVRAALLWLVFLGTAAGGIAFDETVLVVVSIAAVFSALLVYPALTETIWNGRTPGKMAMGLRVVTVEGAPIRFRHAAIRSALGLVDFLLGAGTLAIVCALATRQSQRLGDLAAGTIVIRERQVRSDSQPVAFSPPPGWERYAASLDVSRLGGEAYVLVRSFLLRVHELDPTARRTRAASLAGRVAAAIDVPLHPGTDPEGFLVAVAAAHQARHADRGPAPHLSLIQSPSPRDGLLSRMPSSA
jgi:uncharacterized RDD family membrane protein YckC